MKKLIPWESSCCFSISPEFSVVWLIYSDEELLAAKRNRLEVNITFSGRCFAGCLPFFRAGQGGVLEKQEAGAEEAGVASMTLHLTCAFQVIKLPNERVIALFHHFFLQFLHITEICQKAHNTTTSRPLSLPFYKY